MAIEYNIKVEQERDIDVIIDKDYISIMHNMEYTGVLLDKITARMVRKVIDEFLAEQETPPKYMLEEA